MITKKMKVQEAVKEKPYIVEFLSDNNIDFCCGGWQVLEDAIEKQGLNVDEFINEINDLQVKHEAKDWRQALSLDKEDLIDYIVLNHHRKEESLLEEVERLLIKILYVHYENHGEALSEIYKTFLSLKQDLMPHFADEEKIVFPKALDNDKTDWSKLRDDHEQVGELLKKLQLMTKDFTPPEDACPTYKLAFKKLHELVDDIHLHVFLENSVLFEK
ncbi:regulator of cell morphogenesis and NO signaling [Hathewaya proteolytica DSM 3090]|uniref:Regulator of cell morphogenesis and NO signaling n=1 Tax=Hathewaya proteolytica DSM 3090 TaxID=1121331 RepID=A0A1M6SW18_9CLOT|nr:DUF542 domain-containing protein [Hathewaya proteolytica]SHK48904.1 regulator of cell morphogenesis and NO signaling [Hathewaya proteolytica DSM 3090]